MLRDEVDGDPDGMCCLDRLEYSALSLTCGLTHGDVSARSIGTVKVVFGRRSPAWTRRAAVHCRAMTDLEVFGKAATGTGSPSTERGDCPFSQRVYIELEEKKLPYKATYVEEGPNKPDWFMEKNPSGLMPVLRDGETWIQDSEKICSHLESKFPEPPLKTPEQLKNVGAGVFPAFTKWLESKDPSSPTKQDFLKELSSLNDHLQKNGPYIAGDKPTDADFALAPKLRHARVALGHFMEFPMPQEFEAIRKYIQLMEARPSFRKTDSPDEMIIFGWKKKFSLPDKLVTTK